ncbi:hypothetical protein P8452_60795 [Trifolium repens]|nr:hypothetical protein P8452_60795 [Trifolium repens]
MGRVARSYFTREDNEGTYGGAYGQKESMLEISDTSQRMYGCQAMMLKTIAAVPGMDLRCFHCSFVHFL